MRRVAVYRFGGAVQGVAGEWAQSGDGCGDLDLDVGRIHVVADAAVVADLRLHVPTEANLYKESATMSTRAHTHSPPCVAFHEREHCSLLEYDPVQH